MCIRDRYISIYERNLLNRLILSFNLKTQQNVKHNKVSNCYITYLQTIDQRNSLREDNTVGFVYAANKNKLAKKTIISLTGKPDNNRASR